MPTKKDFVRWKLEGPREWPINGIGWTYIGVYNEEGYELFVNHKHTTILIKSPHTTDGTLIKLTTLFLRARRSGDLGLMMRLYRDYKKCLPQPTS